MPAVTILSGRFIEDCFFGVVARRLDLSLFERCETIDMSFASRVPSALKL